MASLDELVKLKAAALTDIKAELQKLETLKTQLLQKGLHLEGAIAALLELKGPSTPSSPPSAPTAQAAVWAVLSGEETSKCGKL